MQRGYFEVLDATRGIAAIGVLVFHLGCWLDHRWLAANSGLAVDFFFCLSGFVVAKAYGSKLDGGLTVKQFMAKRLRRLAPTMAIASAIAAAYVLVRIVAFDLEVPLESWWVAFVFGTLNIPHFGASETLGGPQVFPLNGPQYSLFLEVVVNLLWACDRRFRGSAGALAIAVAGYSATAVCGLGGAEVHNFWTGFPRVIGTFYLGVGLYDLYRKRDDTPATYHVAAFYGLALISLAIMLAPVTAPHWISWLWTATFSPLLVWTGAFTPVQGRGRQVALWLGRISFPLYALHYPTFQWVNGLYQAVVGRRDSLPIMLLTFGAAITVSLTIEELTRSGLQAWLRPLRLSRATQNVRQS